tara:strand:- start:41570 stop:41962 length:393 start_codon:yes stop_codon:yes gene_type:complete
MSIYDSPHLRGVNAQAAKVLGSGEHYAPAKLAIGHVFETCPPMRPVPEHTQDLTGVVWDRLTVVGLAVQRAAKKNRGARWACRCRCGNYTLQSAKAIKQALPERGRCVHCERTLILRKRTSGRFPPRAAE